MAKTNIRDGESLDQALRRFKRDVSRSGDLRTARQNEYYEKPSAKRKRKSEEARKRNKRRNRRR